MVIRHLVAALWGRVKFRYRDHTQLLTNGRAEMQCQKGQAEEEALSAAVVLLLSTEI